MKKNAQTTTRYLLVLLFFPLIMLAQGPGSLFIDAGPDVNADCASGGCANITATFLETFDTSGLNYSVNSVPYTPPFAFNGLANPLNPNIDDAWSPVDTLPFDFCFFGSLETEFQVGSNGVVRFDVDPLDIGVFSNNYVITQDLPNNTEEALAESNVFTPAHDIDPAVSSTEEIGYEVLGVYPNRVLIVSYYEVPLFSGACNSLLATHMAVFYEFSNVVEIYIQDKPVCPTWQNGAATLGIQNDAGTTAYVPPGRNTSDSPWTTNNEAWSFNPIGPPTYVFEWLDSTGAVIGTTPTINVCVVGSGTFTAQITYTNTCNGDTVVLTDDVVVTTDATFIVDLGPDIETCLSNPILLNGDAGVGGVTYQWSLGGVPIVGATNPTYTVTAPNSGTYSVLVSDGVCDVMDDVIVTFLPQPIIANQPNDLFICNDGSSPGVFDLTVNDSVILGIQNPALFNITYHNSQADADTGMNAIATPTLYTITGTNETIYVRIEDLTGICFATANFIIDFSLVSAGPMTNLDTCDKAPLGSEFVDLPTAKDAEALNTLNPAEYVVTYHITQFDADNDINPLPVPHNVTGPSEVIYVRVENIATTSCFATANFVVNLAPTPIANPPVDLFQCDFGTTSGVFDLTINDANILGGQNPALFNIKYYETLLDSQNDTNMILGPAVHLIVPPSPQTIFVRIEDLSGTCFDLEQFEIYFSRAIAGLVPVSFNICDFDGDGGEFIDLFVEFNALVLDGEPSSNYDITYHLSQADADGDVNPLPNPYFVTAPNQVIYIRLEHVDDATCFDTTQNVDVIIDSLPVVNPTPDTLVLCDPNNDGFAEFDLSLATLNITLGDPVLTVSYHGTLLDATNDLLPLPLLYTNDQIYLDAPVTDITDPLYGTGGVWARVESSVSSCFVVVSFALEVRFAPNATTPAEPLRLCDDAVADGFTFFDLTVVAPEVLGTMDPTQFDLYYYENNADAVAAGMVALTAPDYSQAIATPGSFLNSTNPQDIYILVVGNATSTVPPNPNSGEGCYDIVTLTLIVDPIPEDLGPFELNLCDDDLNGSTLDDEISTFDLTAVNTLVNGGDPTIMVLWYETLADELADNPIVDPTMYQNTATPQTIIGRATSEFGCRNTVTLTLTVFPNPNPKTDPTALELCDDDDDGLVGGFDLTLADVEIIDGELDVSVLYYEDLAVAMAGVPGTEIMGLYTNIVPNSQIIYARVSKDVPPATLGCFTIVELELIVIPLPDMPDATFQDPFIGCDESGSGQAIFDLTLQDGSVLGSQLASDFLPITYYQTLVDATAATNAIAPATAFLSGGQAIWVRLESLVTGCVRITEFQIEVGLFPTIGTGDDLFACDDQIGGSTPTDGLSTFDLTVNTTLIDLGDPTLMVQYYATASDQANNIPIADPSAYQNIITPQQQIFVSGISTQGCEAITSFLITVEPNPVVGTPDPLIVCDPNNDGFAEFDLTLTLNAITLGDPNLTVTYHGTYLDADNGVLPLVNPYTNEDIYNDVPVTDPLDPLFGTGGVWARVETTVNSCHTVVPFALEVRFGPMAISPEPLHACDDAVIDGFTTFDLTSVATEVLGTLDATMYDLYYYENNADAITAGDAALIAPDFSLAIATPGSYINTVNPQDIYILVIGNATSMIPPNPNSGEGCYDIVTLTLIVDPIPLDLGPFAMDLCDDDLNGSTLYDEISTFDLTTQNVLVTGGDPTITVQWYATPADEAADNPIADPTMFQNSATPQTIIGRATSEFGCSNTVTLTLTVYPNPVPNFAPTPIELCDDDDDGLVAGFDLTLRDTEILNGQLASVLYYEDLATAMAGVPGTEIVGLYTNIVPNSQIVYARVTLDAPPAFLACWVIVELELIVIALPDMPDATFQDPLVVCDQNGGGQAIFDLTAQDGSVLGTQVGSDFLPISYHISQADADAGLNAITPATAFLSAGQTIWVRLESILTGCARVTSFELEVGVFPAIAAGDDLYLCDDEINGSVLDDGLSTFDLTVNTSIIDMGDTTLGVTYYGSASDQTNNIPIVSAQTYQNILTPQQQIFVSVLNGQGCEATTSFFINVEANPVAMPPTPLVLCDVNSDGFGAFTLTDKDLEITGGVVDVSVSYHETLSDAENNVFALVSPYTNIVATTQVVYARVFNDVPPTVLGCWAIVELELQVTPSPLVPNDLPALVICDDDGFGVFDLTVQDALIYGVQDPMDYTLTYHETLADAQAGLNAIATPAAYTNTVTPEQTVYVRLSDNAGGCFATAEFLLQVSLGPVVNQPTPLTVCDDLGSANDGIAAFDLTLKNDEITGAVAGVEVRYYETLLDAQDDTNRIDPETGYVNTGNPQTIYVRVIDGNTGCFDTSVTLSIRVSPNPTPITPAAIETCDDTDSGDGIEVFDLTQREAVILNGETWHIAYYELLADALVGDLTTSIATPTAYSNTSNPQIIYVRVTGDITNVDSCFEIVELELIVHPLPDDSGVIELFTACEVNSNGQAVFDLSTKIPEVLNGQDPLDFAVTFYRSASDASGNLNPIVNPTTFQNTTNPQTIYTGITHIVTGCYIGSSLDAITNEYSISFDLEVLEGATATAPAAPYVVCDNTDPNDGFADFTLYNLAGDPNPDPLATALSGEILGGQTTPPYELSFYETLAQADAGDPTMALGNVYTNTINPQIIYARVTNIDTNCYEVAEVILKVEQLPLISLEETYRLCVDANGNPIPEEEGGMSPPLIDSGLDPTLYDIVWEYPGGTAFGPSIIAIEGGSYSVTYIEIATGCSATVTTTVTVSQPPVTYEAVLVNGAFAQNDAIQATATGMGTYVFQLDDGPFNESGLFENVSPGIHTVTIKDANGCGSVTIEIGVIDYPRFVTPNQDGFHDTWNIIGIAAFDPTAKIYIFDRFGKLLKQVSPLGTGWNGTYNGNPLPSSDYWFVIEYTEEDVQKEFKGHFTLKR